MFLSNSACSVVVQLFVCAYTSCMYLFPSLCVHSLEVCTGRNDLPYDNLEESGVQVYGLPDGIPFHSPILYTQQQLQQILANQEKIVFLKIPNSVSEAVSSSSVSEECVTRLVS